MLTFYKYLDESIRTRLFKKQSDETISIKADFTNAIESGEVILATSIVTAYDSSDIDVTSTIISGDPTILNPAITIKIQGGEDGKKYKITFQAITTEHTYELDIFMLINDI